METITPVDVARAAGLDPKTARRYIDEELSPLPWERTRRKIPADQLPAMVELCKSKQKRKCRNKFNSVLIENDRSLALSQGGAA